jgi:hypothetical protein
MNWYPGPDGQPRIWYEPEEIEDIAEEELRRAKLTPILENPVTDLEHLVKVHLKAKPDQRAKLPEYVLGVTHFQSRQKSQSSEPSPNRPKNRLRTRPRTSSSIGISSTPFLPEPS